MNRFHFWAILAVVAFCSAFVSVFFMTQDSGVLFFFKEKKWLLQAPMKIAKQRILQRGGVSSASLDSASNCYYTGRKYVEIIRQDDPFDPQIGVALGFEFDDTNGEYPYTPEYATIQVKDFTWGGVEFSSSDTLNYTGVSNAVSEDLFVEIENYRQDTIFGRFSGVLLNGAGGMATIDSGYFRVKLCRK
jgi:hypothetical protein